MAKWDLLRTGETDAKASLSAFSLRLLVEKIPAVLRTTDKELHLTSVTGAALAAMNVRPENYLGVSLISLSALLGQRLGRIFLLFLRTCRFTESTFFVAFAGYFAAQVPVFSRSWLGR
jgi:hypothetical protein